MLLAVYTLTCRELVGFFRQRNRVIGALGQPIIFWLLFGTGLGASFRPAGAGAASYMEYFFPGTVVLILLFTAIFSTISIIEDRREGFLQSVLVAPLPRSGLVLGKLVGGTVLASVQALLFLLAGLTQGLTLNPLKCLMLAGVIGLIAFALTGLGFIIAWRSETTQGFHAIMSVFLFPMWLLSGAFFPAAGTPTILRTLIALNPLTYGLALLRHILYWGSEVPLGDEIPGPLLSLIATLCFALAMFVLSYVTAGRRTRGDLQ